jgi:hypothetical protein
MLASHLCPQNTKFSGEAPTRHASSAPTCCSTARLSKLAYDITVQLARGLTLLAILVSTACAEPEKVVLEDIVVIQFETQYYLRHSGVEAQLLGFGPLETLGWNHRYVAACATRSGCRVVNAKTHDGWTRVLSSDEVAALVGTSIQLIPISRAWRQLPGWPPW